MSLQPQQTDLSAIRQKRMDAISTKHIHREEIVWLDKWNKLIDYLPLAAVAIYLPIRALAKDLGYSFIADAFWEVAGGFFVAAATGKILYFQGRLETHSKLRDENIALADEAEALLRQPEQLTPATVTLFFAKASKLHQDDQNALRKLSEKKRQFGYRQALKEIDPTSVSTTCPRCFASPWNFKPGNCQMCGGTPVAQPTTQLVTQPVTTPTTT